MIDKNFYKLVFTGTITGIVASFVGGGAEILIVPLLIYLGVFADYKIAVGTSLASLLLPIGAVAVYFYSTQKCSHDSCVHWSYALIISLFFVLGTFFSYFTVTINNNLFKKVFAIFMILLGTIMLLENA
jgi:uncharacterized membrane protein YfcA